MREIPYSRRHCLRWFGFTGYDCERGYQLRFDRDYDIPILTIYAGRFGYAQLFLHAVR